MTHIRQSRPDSGRGVQIQVQEFVRVVPSLLSSSPNIQHATPPCSTANPPQSNRTLHPLRMPSSLFPRALHSHLLAVATETAPPPPPPPPQQPRSCPQAPPSPAPPPAPIERNFIELMTADREIKTSREGSKRRIYGTCKTATTSSETTSHPRSSKQTQGDFLRGHADQ